MRLDSELSVAMLAIRKAGALVLEMYALFERIDDAPADISTAADKASQESIFCDLHAAFPNDHLCGEETTAKPNVDRPASHRTWIVDPIDGTRGFAQKNDEFSIMIALVDSGEVLLGIVHEPAIDRMTYAVSGQGCWLRQPVDAEPRKCTVSATDDLSRSVLSMSRSQGALGRQQLLTAFGAARAVETFSAGIKLAQVACGETDLYLGDYLTLKDWDVCAGHILVKESGGTVTNVDGRPIQYDGSGKSLGGRGILATNGALHRAALQVIRSGRYAWP